jgi:hypothetical protein
VTVPLPVPLSPEAIVSQLALEVAVLPHAEVEALTLTLPVPPPLPKDWLVGEMEKLQPRSRSRPNQRYRGTVPFPSCPFCME